MASQLVNELCYIKHCWSVYEQNNIVSSVRVDDWIAKLVTISTRKIPLQEGYVSTGVCLGGCTHVTITHNALISLYRPLWTSDMGPPLPR